MLYRGIRVHVQTEVDPEFTNRKPYAAGNEKTWWTFTSTTEDLEATKAFVGESEGTLFTLSGKPWGYDISMLSDFPDEKEILLEPERKLKITSVTRDSNYIFVNAEMVKKPLVLEDVIKVETAKIKARKSTINAVPEKPEIVNVTGSTVELYWPRPQNVKAEKTLSYQVSVRKNEGNFFWRSAERLLEVSETRCVIDNIEGLTEYEFRVRCGFRGAWGNWGRRLF